MTDLNTAKKSSYYEDLEYLVSVSNDFTQEVLNSIKTKEQATRVGMGYETASIQWMNGKDREYFKTEDECVNAYVSGAFAEAMGYWY